MIEKLSLKLVRKKIVAFLVLTFLIVIFPPPSLSFLWYCLGTIFFTISCMVFSLKYRNAVIYLFYYAGAWMIFFLLSLRFWNLAFELSYKLFLGLLPGFVLAVLIPFINRDVSEYFFLAQAKPNKTTLLLTAVIWIIATFVVGFLWNMMGIMILQIQNKLILPVLLGFLLYTAVLVGLYSGSYLYVSGRFQHWLENS